MRKFLARLIASATTRKIQKASLDPAGSQEAIFRELIRKASHTAFGNAHDFKSIRTYEDFKQRVPVKDYEQAREWFDRTRSGEADVLWPGKPLYLAKTSGTTSGAKYIPITRESISNHINGAKHALLAYIHRTGKADFVSGKMIFLQGSPELEEMNGIATGRLSGIVAHHVPKYLQKNRMPSYATNCIEDWEEKVDAIAKETVNERMTLISGIPPWVQMYFDRLRSLTGKETVKEIFPGFSLFVYGGVNYEPYREQMEKTIGGRIDTIETYPASEGFIAYQDEHPHSGLLVQVNQGIFFEFVPAEEIEKSDPIRLRLHEVKPGVNYVVVINNNAGLWGYNTGDTVKFVSLFPHRVLVSGRVKHFTSAFGEHVIAEEVEKSLEAVLQKQPARIAEFHVAPQVNPAEGLPYHEWLVAFEKEPEDPGRFAAELDTELRKRNIYYQDLIEGKILQPLVMRSLPPDAFIRYMKDQGKLGGQNKVPRLSNDRSVADKLLEYLPKP